MKIKVLVTETYDENYHINGLLKTLFYSRGKKI